MTGIGVDWEQRVDWETLRSSRVAKMHAAVKDAGLRGLLVQRMENVRYLTSMRGFVSMIYQPRYAAFITDQGDTTLLTEQGDMAIARDKMPWLQDVDFWKYSVQDNVEILSRLFAKHGIRDGQIGVDDVTSPAVILELQKKFPRIEFVDGGPTIADAKLIKHPEEIKILREAAEIAEVGMAAAHAAIGVGVRENVVAAAMVGAMVEAGADALVSYPQCSTDALRRMGSDSRLRAGQTLLIDINVGANGYVGDFARTFIVGKPNSDQKRAFEAQMACMTASFDAIRPGGTTQGIQDAVATIARDADLTDSWHGYITGHGIGTGLGPWEQPLIGTTMGPIDTLREGMVMCLEPGFFDPKIGPVRNEDMVVVTSEGMELLTTYPYDDNLI